MLKELNYELYMLKNYKYRIYPNKEQKELFEKHFGCVRWVYNYGLEKKIKTYKNSKQKISCFELIDELPKLKKENIWLKEVTGQALQMALRNLDNAFTDFFKQKNAFPKFKNKNSNNSFQLPQNVRLQSNLIILPKIKGVKIVIDRTFQDKIKTTTISKTPTGKYFASILVDNSLDLPEKQKINKAIGIDVGIKTYATLSTGEKIENPKYLKNSLKRLKVLQRRMSKKVKGSKNRNKARLRVALQYEKITNQRQDFLHKLSSKLIAENQGIALEDLNVKGMGKNHKLAQAIHDCAWSEFMRMLEYKASWYGKTVKKIGRFEPSSKICSCGEINNNLTLADRTWTCKKCNTYHDRDILAAQNILKFSGLGKSVGPVELLPLGRAVKQEVLNISHERRKRRVRSGLKRRTATYSTKLT